MDTELISRNHRAEKQLDVSFIVVELGRLLAMSIASKITSFKGTGCSKNWVTRFCIQLEYHHFCGRCEGVQGVLTLVRRGAARVCHVLRVEELREQLEVEEEDGDRQEEEEEVEREKRVRESAPWMTMQMEV